jgi:hypothetical protein
VAKIVVRFPLGECSRITRERKPLVEWVEPGSLLSGVLANVEPAVERLFSVRYFKMGCGDSVVTRTSSDLRERVGCTLGTTFLLRRLSYATRLSFAACSLEQSNPRSCCVKLLTSSEFYDVTHGTLWINGYVAGCVFGKHHIIPASSRRKQHSSFAVLLA